MKYHVLYNPLAGNDTCEEKTKKFADALQGGEIEFYDVTKIDYKNFCQRLPQAISWLYRAATEL